MHLVTRSQWGARPSRYELVYIAGTSGVKVHYEGTPVPASLAEPASHSKCDDRMRALQASHLANTKEDYSDIAYNFVVCPHGYVYEGRGLHKKTAANGNQPLNKAHYAVCAMLGSEGLTKPTDAQLAGLRDAIDYLRSKGGAGNDIKGHRDGYPTECPGGPLYAWVQKGAPRPDANTSPQPSAKPKVSLAHIVYAAKHDPAAAQGHTSHKAEVLLVEKALKAEGLLSAQWVDGSFGSKTVTAYARWQRSPAGGGFTGDDADGIPGMTSLKLLAARHGFTVTD
ncbi:N-acetylmuramoyl-L-alanine amidase [Streptomyces anandii]|uniref:N-acetylmuramoyl-L-alanine amidase n=1 Tax=Streptomyces anandii TaxID=285454 RepID=A0ABW6GXC0_9ACTN